MTIEFPKIEQKILKFWKDNKIFEKTLKKTQKGPKFIFYEGPPFANAMPGIHHLLARAFKDIILRYKTMQGFFVKRKAGWDTHGLPTEIEAEKKLGIKNKREIEKIGIEKFIGECSSNVFTYKKEWEEFTERIGFWLDFKNAYITCSNDYIESLWWILKQIWQKKLLYQDYKVVPYCPRCGTSLSSHEVAQGYKKIKDPSLYLKLPVKGEKNTYLLVWTTTPWTLPGNVAVAVNPEFSYVKIKVGEEFLILAKERLNVLDKEYKIVEELKGKELLGMGYQPLFDFAKPDKKAYLVVAGDFVSQEEGTGLVHMAPAFGQDDMRAAKENNLSVIVNVDTEGKFTKDYNPPTASSHSPEGERAPVNPWAGRMVTDEKLNKEIIEELQKKKLLFGQESFEHDYPFCWRCDSKLIYYAKDSWFIKMTALKKELIENNKKINWIPEYIKEGRFGEWLREVKDWNLTRERYWGTPLPIWRCDKCSEQVCIGSIKELIAKSKSKIKDLHRPFIDKITFQCECGGQMKRVPEVIDCWFDSGSMPFGQWHYPFENKDKIDKDEFFPADFISEGIDQTRGWFYTLLAISTLLGKGTSYKNVICLGLVHDKYGRKMSKSRGNIVSPQEVIEKYGADVARFYFYTVNPAGEAKRFDLKEMQDLSRKFFDTLIQSFNFFSIYEDKKFKPKSNFKSKDLLDHWVVSKLNGLNLGVVKNLDNYEVVPAARLLEDFVDNLSNWYIRRSRQRFQRPETGKEKDEATQTLYYVLLNLVKLLAPFTPFVSEYLYQQLEGQDYNPPTTSSHLRRAPKSVHLADYPKPDKKLIDLKLEKEMEKVREIVAKTLAKRTEAGIKVRQPLQNLKVKDALVRPADGSRKKLKMSKELLDLIKEEVNVKEIIFDSKIKEEVELDTKITPELKEEGQVREIIRHLQELRKKAGLIPKDKILIYFSGSPQLAKVLFKNKTLILKETRAKDLIRFPEKEVPLGEKKLKIDSEELNLAIRKVEK